MLQYFLFHKILTTLNEVSAYKAQQFLSSTCYEIQVPLEPMLINPFRFCSPLVKSSSFHPPLMKISLLIIPHNFKRLGVCGRAI